MSARRRLGLSLAVVAVVSLAAACMPGSRTASPTAGDGSPGPSTTPTASSAGPSATPAGPPAVTDLGLRGSAYPLGDRVRMAPAPDGSLYVAIPQATGARLVLLDGAGRPREGWPVVVPDSTFCGLLLAAEDGSVRAVCDATDLPQPELEGPPGRAFGFDAQGRALAGWPVQVPPGVDERLVDDELRLVEARYLTDAVEEGQVSHEVSVLAIAADGSLRRGRPVRMVENCCGHSWTVGPDGVAYGVYHTDPDPETQAPRATDLFAVSLDGAVPGWPQRLEGVTSGPSFDRAGTIVLVVGSHTQAASHVVAYRPAGGAAMAASPRVPLRTAEWAVDGGAIPAPPLIAPDGTTLFYSDLDGRVGVFALRPFTEEDGDRTADGGQVVAGWPYRASVPLGPAGYCEPETICFEPRSAAALAGDGTLFLPLAAASEKVGGALLAVGPDAQARAGWPVELRRPGAAFWSVVAGSDGTAFALAVEPEAGGKASASILAVAQDSTVRSITTVLEP